ncbi:platelet endothelial cell adhesion molecule isoform X2 [Megalobrama amblycephala]|uniref:platelet endothelial cell adhesion molecule isoform X2 n=1 Tax=Megalobrama amblycephala TaxID=75352 RepID=UPI002013D539|nr:platelet endothelial cell adhesion molecule isoform X2 [Megalobrama amblycephala]
MLPSNVVQRGTKVSLKCQPEVSSSQGSHLNYEYIFFKDYVPLNTDQMNATDSLYSIPDARVSHSGKYKCAVVIKKERKESPVKDLKVKGLLTPVLNVDKLTLTEGDDVTAVCTAEGETGFLTFFFRDGPEELYWKETSSQKVEHNLTVTKRHENMFCYYTVKLSDSLETSNNSNVISVDFQELKIKPDIKVMPSTDVIEGDLITFSCSVNMTHQRNSELRIHLIHKSTMLSSNMTQEDYKMFPMANGSGKYECISKLGDVLKPSSVYITVKELFSVPVLSIHPDEVFEGENFTISCNISSFASEKIQREDITYSIFRDKTSVINNNKYSGIAGKVTNGKYMCMAKANEITKESQGVLFGAKVLVSKPEITTSGLVIVDKPFLIHCHSKNGSLPIIYSLKRNNITLNRTEVSDPHEKAQFLALISTPSDISSYLCAAENNGRVSIKMSERLHVTVIVPVGKPLMTVVPVPGNIEEGDNITLICGIPKGSPPISFRFYASNHTPIHNTTVQSNSSSFVLSTVNRENSGNYYCDASNNAGMSRMSNIVTVEVSLAKWKKALIAVFFMLLMVLLVLFIMIRYKAKRGKREMAAKLSVKPASPKSDDSLTLSLTHDTHYSAHTVEVNNKESVWSERPPDQDSLESPNEGDVEYTEVVHPQPEDPTRIPLRKGTDTVYSELQTSQGDPEHINHFLHQFWCFRPVRSCSTRFGFFGRCTARIKREVQYE